MKKCILISVLSLVLAVSIVLVSILFCPMVMAAPPYMPTTVQMVQPDPSLPKELAAFWGKWEGSGYDSGLKTQIQLFLIVEKITEEKASLYGWHSVHGWGPMREADVTKENGKYKLSFLGSLVTM